MESVGFGAGQATVIGFMGFTWMLVTISFSLPIFIAAPPDREVLVCPPESRLPESDLMQVGGACSVGEALSADEWCSESLRQYWHYADKEETVTAEWDLICGSQMLAASVGSAFFFGFMGGNLLFSPLPDKIGRCPAYVICMAAAAAGAAVCAYSESFAMYLAGRVWLGVGQGGAGNIAYISAREVVGTRHTAQLMGVMMSFWAGGTVLLVLLTLITLNWRVLSQWHFMAHVGMLILAVIAWRRGLESPEWLYLRGRESAFRHTMKWLAGMNRRECPIPVGSVEAAPGSGGNKDADEEEQEEGNWDILLTQPLGWWSVLIILAFCSCSFGYFGLSLGSGSLGSSVRVSTALSALVEIPAVFVAQALANSASVGRAGTVFGGIGFSGLFCLLAAVIPQHDNRATLAAVAGKLCVSVAYDGLYLLVGEVYPATYRGFALGIFTTASRLAGIMAPWVDTMQQPWPLVCIGAALVSTSGLLIGLPETLGQESAPTSVAEISERYQAQKGGKPSICCRCSIRRLVLDKASEDTCCLWATETNASDSPFSVPLLGA